MRSGGGLSLPNHVTDPGERSAAARSGAATAGTPARSPPPARPTPTRPNPAAATSSGPAARDAPRRFRSTPEPGPGSCARILPFASSARVSGLVSPSIIAASIAPTRSSGSTRPRTTLWRRLPTLAPTARSPGTDRPSTAPGSGSASEPAYFLRWHERRPQQRVLQQLRDPLRILDVTFAARPPSYAQHSTATRPFLQTVERRLPMPHHCCEHMFTIIS
jgi:hypothetical protein